MERDLHLTGWSGANANVCSLKKGRAGTMTHDYKRNGTTTLFAALDMATGTVIGAPIRDA